MEQFKASVQAIRTGGLPPKTQAWVVLIREREFFPLQAADFLQKIPREKKGQYNIDLYRTKNGYTLSINGSKSHISDRELRQNRKMYSAWLKTTGLTNSTLYQVYRSELMRRTKVL